MEAKILFIAIPLHSYRDYMTLEVKTRGSTIKTDEFMIPGGPISLLEPAEI